jgi:hypothetical protein
MLVLPIVNNRHVMNVELRLRGVEKIRQGVTIADTKESEIIVNSEKYSNSSYFSSKDATSEVDFIRSKSILYPRDYFITTKSKKDSDFYDVYSVSQPPAKVSPCLDALYSKAVTDLRSETPGVTSNGRYVSFADLGFNKDINDDMSLNLYRLLFIFSMCNQLTYCDIGKVQSDSFLKNIYYYNSFYISHPNYALMMFFQFMLFINIYIADQNGIKKRGNSLSRIKQQQQQPHLNLQITIYDNEHYGVAQWNDISRVLYMQCALKLFIIANLPKKVISLYNSISILITNPVYYVHENQIFPDFIPSFYSKVMNFSMFKLLTNANIKSIFKNINQFTVSDCFIHGYNTSDEIITILKQDD